MGCEPLSMQALVETSFTYGLDGLICTWIPAQAYTPENRQQDFLDRYRR